MTEVLPNTTERLEPYHYPTFLFPKGHVILSVLLKGTLRTEGSFVIHSTFPFILKVLNHTMKCFLFTVPSQ